MRICRHVAVMTLLIVGAGCSGGGDGGYEDSDTQRHVDRQVDQKDMNREDRNRLPR